MKTLVASLLITTIAVTAAVAKADRYQSPAMIEAITAHDYNHLAPTDPDHLKARVGYVAGFTLYFDRSCDFLPQATFEKLANSVKALASKDGNEEAIFKAGLMWGVEDAREFLAQNGCATSTAKSARQTLENIWINKPSGPAKPDRSI